MQFDDPRSILESAAAKPERGIDPHALTKRGRRLRRSRYAAVAAGLAVTIAGTSASVGMLDGDGRRQVAGVEECGEPDAIVSVYLRADATEAEIAALQAELEARPEVAEVDYMSGEETREALAGIVDEWGSEGDLAPHLAHLRVEAVDRAGAGALEDLSGPAISFVTRGPSPRDIACRSEIVCNMPGPSPMASFFLHDDAPKGEVLALRDALRAEPGVTGVQYVSKERAYEEFTRLYEGEPELYETIDPGDLPASLRVRAADRGSLERIAALESPIVDEVRSSGDLYERLCGGAVPDPIPSLRVEEESSSEDESRHEPFRSDPPVDAELLRAECAVAGDVPAGQVAGEPDRAWCLFDLRVTNSGRTAVRVDYGDATLYVTGSMMKPWMPGGESPAPAGKLFAGAIAPGASATGRWIFRTEPGKPPRRLELWVDSLPAGLLFDLDYDCTPDLRDDPDGKCTFGGTLRGPDESYAIGAMNVTLWHCGVEEVWFAGRQWVVPEPPFDATNAPEEFTGEGSFEVVSERRARFVDKSGIELTFVADDTWQPPPCE